MNKSTACPLAMLLATLSLLVASCEQATAPTARPDHPGVQDPMSEWSATHLLRYIQDGEVRQTTFGEQTGMWAAAECRYRAYVAEHGSGEGFNELVDDTLCGSLGATSADNFCRQTLCAMANNSCSANLGMELAQSTGRVTWLEWRPEAERVTWMVQSTGDRAIAAYWAAWWVGHIEDYAGMGGPSDFADATDCGMPGWPNGEHEGTVLDRLGAEIADQYAVLREAHEASSRYLTASADASITGRWPNIEFLTEDDSSVSLRRLAASGLVPLTVDAELQRDEYCPTSTGDPSVDAATRLIRLSALDPQLLTGVDSNEPPLREFGQTVMARVVRLRGGFAPTEPVETFLQREGTDLTGLLGARERLAREVTVLRRSMTQLLPSELPTFDEDPVDFDTRMFATTATEPSTYLPVANLVGALDGEDGDGGEQWWANGIPFWWSSRGDFLRENEAWGGVDWTSSQVNVAQIFHELGSVLVARGDATSDPALAENFRRVGSAAQRLAGLDVDGTVVMGTYFFDIDEETFDGGVVAASHSGRDLVLVQSIDAVQCATTGRIESVPCDWEDTEAQFPEAISLTAFGGLDPTRPEEPLGQAAYAVAHAGRQFARWTTSWPEVDWDELRHADPAEIAPRPIFILERLAGHSARVPGAYRVWSLTYQEFDSDFESDEDGLGYRTAVSAALLSDAASLVAPSPADCARPANFCAATGLDGTDRIALENDLTDNGNATEDSWQRYLQLARAAADQADALGERALADVQTIDERAESAAAELENICGVTIDPDELAEAFQSSSASSLVDVLRGMTGSAAARRLVRCLGGERILPYVGLGTSPVCLYHPAGRPWELCETGEEPTDGEPLPECPRVIPDGSTCNPEMFGLTDPELDVEVISVPLSRMLKFFTAPTTGGSKPSTNALCAHVRAVNQSLALGARPNVVDAGSIMTERFFAPGNLQEFARKIRWEAEPHDHSTVYIGDTAVLSTGSPWGNRRTTVAAQRPNDCTLSPNALFCEQGNLAYSVALRRETNGRLAGAATIARWLGGESYVDFVVPYHIEGSDQLPTKDHRTPANYRLSQDSSGGTYRPDAQWLVDYRGTDPDKSANTYTCWDRPAFGSNSFDDVWGWVVEYPGEDTWHQQSLDANCGSTGPAQRAIVFERLAGEHVYGYEDEVTAYEADVDRRRADLFLERMLVPNGEVYSFWTQLGEIADGTTSSPRVTTACTKYNPALGALQEVNCYQEDFGDNLTLPLYVDGDVSATTSSPRGVKLLENYGVPHHATVFPYVGGEHIHYRTVLDAMELLCEAGLDGGQIDFSSETEQVRTLDDVYIVERNLQRTADRYRRLGSRIVMTDMPQDVFEALSETGTAVGVAPDGQYGANLLSTRNAVVGLATLPDELATELEGMARDIRAVSDEVRRLDLGSQLNKNQFASAMSSQISRCLVASANAVSLGQVVNWGESAAVAITCADAMAQIAIAARTLALQGSINQIDSRAALLRFEEKSSQRMVRVTSVGRRLVESTNALNAALTNLEAIRLDGRRALERMAFVGTGEADMAYYANTSLQRRYNTSHERYARAHVRAVQAAYMARLAIEQRVGADLNSFGDDMTLVEAPVTWADSLCATVGFDAEDVRDPSDPDFNVYADAYVGEYVSKLEQFMASYSNDFPFGGGDDVAVVSLRDDVNQTHGWCDVETRNLLYHTADIAAPAAEPDGTLGWLATNCLEDAEGEALPNCVSTTTLGGPEDAVGVGNMSFGTLVPTRLTYGLHCDQLTCGWQAGVRYVQTVAGTVTGRQRVSWFARGPGASGAVEVRNLTTGAVVVPTTAYFAPVSEESTWVHYWYDVSFATPTSIAVEVRPAAEVAGSVLDIAGLMLEHLPVGSVASDEPRFTSTSENRTLSVQQCEDTDGIVFRQQSWTRHCRRVCPGGTSVTCDEGESYDECYWETQFDVSERDIARGVVFGSAGFARGNFNYRMQSLAVNFVGSASRTCEDSSNPSTCYNAGFIHYSLEHEGPYMVENYFGDSYSAPVFVGRINYARGLAAERHLTNPVSESLIGQYTRSELRGRPLTGTYKLRVHDEPGVNFEGIEDVQLLVGYDYWTRQN